LWYTKTITKKEKVKPEEIVEMPEYDYTSKPGVWFIRVSLNHATKEMEWNRKYWSLFLPVINSIIKCAEETGVELDEDILGFLEEEYLLQSENFDESQDAMRGLLHSLVNIVQIVIVITDFENYKNLFGPKEDKGGICRELFILSAKSGAHLSASILVVSEEKMEGLVKQNMGPGSDFYAAYEEQAEGI